jgi:N-acetylglucosaminyl-diphospho-decaprenol L-rhamnosyltransferase
MTLPLPRVDVGIVCWNTRDLTVDAIGRLLAAADGVDLRVLVRDNGSTDGTVEAVRERYPSLAVDVGDNVGFAAGVNSLLARSDAPWFVTLNSDAWPEAGALRALVDAAERHPRAAVVAPLLLRPDGTLEHSAHPLPSVTVAAVTGLGGQALLGRRRAEELCLGGAWGHDRERSVGWAVGAAWLLRREAVAAVGPLDESLFMYAEDLEWCWRAQRVGWQVWFTPEAVVRHVGNASGEQRYGTSRERVVIANANLVSRRYLTPGRAIACQLLNAAGAVRSAGRAAARGNRGLAGYWWRQLPAHLGREA